MSDRSWPPDDEQIIENLHERVEELESLLFDRPDPYSDRAKLVEWYWRIDAALGADPVTNWDDAVKLIGPSH